MQIISIKYSIKVDHNVVNFLLCINCINFVQSLSWCFSNSFKSPSNFCTSIEFFFAHSLLSFPMDSKHYLMFVFHYAHLSPPIETHIFRNFVIFSFSGHYCIFTLSPILAIRYIFQPRFFFSRSYLCRFDIDSIFQNHLNLDAHAQA